MKRLLSFAVSLLASYAALGDVYHVALVAIGDESGSSAGNAMSMAQANTKTGTADACGNTADTIFLLADDTYTVAPNPTCNGTGGGGPAVCTYYNAYVAKHATPAVYEGEGAETIRGVVLNPGDSTAWELSDECLWIEGMDLNILRWPEFNLSTFGGSNTVFHHVRSVRAWFDKNATMGHDNQTLRSFSFLCDTCIVWGTYFTPASNAPDVFRMSDIEMHDIRFTNSAFSFTNHSMFGVSTDDDYNATLASRDVAHDMMIDHSTFYGRGHMWSMRGGNYGMFLDYVNFFQDGSGDCIETNTTNWYGDVVIATLPADDATANGDQMRFWVYSGYGGASFVVIANGGESIRAQVSPSIRINSGGPLDGNIDSLIERPVPLVHLTIADGFAADISMTTNVNNSNPNMTEINALATIKNSIFTADNHPGDCLVVHDSGTWDDLSLNFSEGGEDFEINVGAGIEASVIGSNASLLVVEWNGTQYNLADAKNTNNVPFEHFEIKASNITAVPNFENAGANNYAPQNTALWNMGVEITNMDGTGSGVATGTIDWPDLFWKTGGPNGGWLALDVSSDTLGDSTLPPIALMDGREFWIDASGGLCGPLLVTALNYEHEGSPGVLTWSGGNCTWSDNDPVHFLDPTVSAGGIGIWVGGVAPTEPAAGGNPTPPIPSLQGSVQ